MSYAKKTVIASSTTADDIMFALRHPLWAKAGYTFQDLPDVWLMLGYSVDEIIIGKFPRLNPIKFMRFVRQNKLIGYPWHLFPLPNDKIMLHLFKDQECFNLADAPKFNTENVVNMFGVFDGAASFNRNIGCWNVANVKTMSHMFHNAASFNQNLGGWDISQVEDMEDIFMGSGMTSDSLSDTLAGWAATAERKGVQNNVSLGKLPVGYSALAPHGKKALSYLSYKFNWCFA